MKLYYLNKDQRNTWSRTMLISKRIHPGAQKILNQATIVDKTVNNGLKTSLKIHEQNSKEIHF